ncbi:MAG: hypothetical protein E7383_03375 [Ruminococcaceae bacterium]|nr:hypothetical protein [Oscillospiraceae bacterium]MBR2599229.1 hypothetical protein [Clostridiales bacterium]
MFYLDHRLTIIIGAYGSGKSEIAVNMSLAQRKALPDKKLLIADLDIVNPFYRSSDCGAVLEEAGIRLITPLYAGSNVDAPVLTPEMYVIFDDESYQGIFDIGGEDMGAIVLGSIRKRIENTDTAIYMAVNTLRPFTSDPEQIAVMTNELTAAAGFKIDGYLNNTNLLEETTAEMLEEGEKKILEASKLTGIPLIANCVMEGVDIPEGKLKDHELFRMERKIHYAY